jgi:hypothetical protein
MGVYLNVSVSSLCLITLFLFSLGSWYTMELVSHSSLFVHSVIFVLLALYKVHLHVHKISCLIWFKHHWTMFSLWNWYNMELVPHLAYLSIQSYFVLLVSYEVALFVHKISCLIWFRHHCCTVNTLFVKCILNNRFFLYQDMVHLFHHYLLKIAHLSTHHMVHTRVQAKRLKSQVEG